MATIQTEAALEAGTVINEHYSVNDYVARRTGYLSKHPDYSHMRTGLFHIARRDASDVYKLEQEQLSVQGVRRREQAAGFDLLLPLPTTNNTETLDSFSSYGPCEWSPSVTWPVARPARIGLDQDNLAMPSSSTATFGNTQSASVSQTTTLDRAQNHHSAPAIAHSPSSSTQRITPPASPNMATQHCAVQTSAQVPQISSVDLQAASAMTQPANTNHDIIHPQEQTMANDPMDTSELTESDHSSDQRRPSNSLMDDSTSTRMTTPMLPSPTGGSKSSEYQEASPNQNELLRYIVDNLDNGRSNQRLQTPSPSTSPVTVGNNVSALAGRGMSVPVKQKQSRSNAAASKIHGAGAATGNDVAQPDGQKQSKKRPASESLDSEALASSTVVQTTEQTPESAAPPLKRLKTLRGPRKPEAVSAIAEKQTAHAKSKPNKKAPTATITNAPRAGHMEAIINGTALPKNGKEAKLASQTRYKRLLAQHQAAHKVNSAARASRARKTDESDMMPEFFDAEAFADDQQVRCVCGIAFDDNTFMVSCEKCTVWQHTACMGAGVPKDVDNDSYHCHVCDPWAHRKLIARLRRERPLQQGWADPVH